MKRQFYDNTADTEWLTNIPILHKKHLAHSGLYQSLVDTFISQPSVSESGLSNSA